MVRLETDLREPVNIFSVGFVLLSAWKSIWSILNFQLLFCFQRLTTRFTLRKSPAVNGIEMVELQLFHFASFIILKTLFLSLVLSLIQFCANFIFKVISQCVHITLFFCCLVNIVTKIRSLFSLELRRRLLKSTTIRPN